MNLRLVVVLALLWVATLSEPSRERRGHRSRDSVYNLHRYIRRLQGCLHRAREKINEMSTCCARIDSTCYEEGSTFNTADGCHTCTCTRDSLECTPMPGACLAVCPPLSDPANGSVSTPEGREAGDEAVYSCSPGFELSGANRRVCLSTGSWSGAAPTCEEIVCPPLSDPASGSVSTPEGREAGDEAVYSCSPGFELSGANRRICLSTGSWSGDAPTCEEIVCPPLSDPASGSVSTPDGQQAGDEAVYSCGFGFELSGANRRVCLSTGSWSGVAPTCEEIDWLPWCNTTIDTTIDMIMPLSFTLPLYPNGIDCTWTITGNGSDIQLRFPEFDFEKCPTCNCDYVEVIMSDGTSSGKLCNENNEPADPYTSTMFTVNLHTDGSKDFEGFTMTLDYAP